MDETERPWQIRVDVGGTFTDGWAILPDGRERRCKVLSSGKIPEGAGLSPAYETGEDAPVVAVRVLTETFPGEGFPPLELRVATTRATNALLERKGDQVTLVTSRGFGSLLEIRDQRRPDLFETCPGTGDSILREVIEVPGRVTRDGEVLEELDLSPLIEREAELKEGVVAVALLHADVQPAMEEAVAEVTGGSVAHELAPVIRFWPRMETAVANAYLAPVMKSFVRALQNAFPEAELGFMTSAGKLRRPERFHPVDSLLSGPAGGVAAAASLAQRLELGPVLTFDMGGTSTDVARINGEPGYRHEQEVGPVRVLAPAVRIETVAAGGGSICQWRHGAVEVGPESAGSYPGPACYGQGGPLTVTDVNLLLGLMDEKRAGIPLFREPAEKKLAELMLAAGVNDGKRRFLEGLREIAVAQMAEALRQVSTRDGYDCREHVLVAFGGAGPQHACALAETLGMTEVVVPGEAGIFSACGLHHADHREMTVRQILRPLAEVQADFSEILKDMAGGRKMRFLHEVRLQGQDATLEVEAEAYELLVKRFGRRYEGFYGRKVDRELEWVTVRAEEVKVLPEGPQEKFTEVPGEGLRVEQDAFKTLVVPEGWRKFLGEAGTVKLRWEGESRAVESPEVVREELYRRKFEGIVQEMGLLLQRTAVSVNIKERHDFSCALLDQEGRLIVNAPHIPVHLGALGLCVRECGKVIRWEDGEAVVVNHPAFGGSHLPDITVVTPVFEEGELLGFVANRAHHAEVGGRTPGSMPPDATCLADEGVVISPIQWRKITRETFTGSRSPEDNLADLEAQVVANRHGAAALRTLGEGGKGGEVKEFMGRLFRRSASLMWRKLEAAAGLHAVAQDAMDDGTEVKVSLQVTGKGMVMDFRGSGEVHPGNLNAPPGIVRSAVLYALRLWLREDLPLNEGLLEKVEILTEPGLLAPPLVEDPASCPAVVGGNIETSQRIVDVLLQALGVQANGQGTMNNVLFGNEGFGFYETLGGGAGAGPGFGGRSAAHVHMSNTAVTDAEVLEERYPVRIREFAVRKGSGGAGEFYGGDGLVREFEFLEEMTVSLLTQRRLLAPRGLKGGREGKTGKQWVLRNEKWEELPGVTALTVKKGDRVKIETPGGGGWGNRLEP